MYNVVQCIVMSSNWVTQATQHSMNSNAGASETVKASPSMSPGLNEIIPTVAAQAVGAEADNSVHDSSSAS